MTIGGLVLQLVLVVQGGRVLDEVDPPSMVLRLARFVAYFTIQSNLLVAVAACLLARDPKRDGTAFGALRLAGITGITVTGVVHFLLLRPLLDLDGADWAADKLLHMVVPTLAVGGWLVFGPRPRVDRHAQVATLAWPIAWLLITLVLGASTGWYPYPFLDHREDSAVSVAVACLAITVLFAAVVALVTLIDRRLASRPGTLTP